MRSAALLPIASVLALTGCPDNARLLDASTDVPAMYPDVAAPDVAPADVAPVDVVPGDAVPVDVAPGDVAPGDVALADVPGDAATGPLGATADDGGVTFRVWAPVATAASVQGDFGEAVMSPEVPGVFAARVADAGVGQAYRFVLHDGDRTLTRVDPRARVLRGGDAVVAAPGAYPWRTAAFMPAPRRETVLYELHVGSFSVAPGDAAGSYASVTARLDDLADLGVNAIELMPVSEFGSATSWGYGPRLWFAPNGVYGSPDDLRRLVDEAHARGIAVVLDVVYNHYTGGHNAPLYCFDGDCSTGGGYGPYFFPDAPYRSTPWGPRPDYSRPEVAACIVDSVGAWVSEYRIDGFRWDSVSNIRGLDGMGTVPGGRDLLVRANALTHAMLPGALVIAEDLKGFDGITRSAGAGGFGFDAQWDGFVYTVGAILAGASDDGRDMNALQGAILGQYNGDPFQRVIATENHDTVGNGGARMPQRIDAADPGSFAARKRSMLAAALALTAPGVPMLFMGQEHLEVGTFANAPAPIDWSRETSFAPVRAYYRALVALRRNRGATTPGLLGAHVEVIHLNATNKVIAFRRWDRGGDDVVVIANLRDRAYTRYDVGLPAGGTWRVRLDGDDPRWSTDFHGVAPATVEAIAHPYDNQAFTGPIVLGPWSVVVLSRDPTGG